jgi:hypothetical protein
MPSQGTFPVGEKGIRPSEKCVLRPGWRDWMHVGLLRIRGSGHDLTGNVKLRCPIACRAFMTTSVPCPCECWCWQKTARKTKMGGKYQGLE